MINYVWRVNGKPIEDLTQAEAQEALDSRFDTRHFCDKLVPIEVYNQLYRIAHPMNKQEEADRVFRNIMQLIKDYQDRLA